MTIAININVVSTEKHCSQKEECKLKEREIHCIKFYKRLDKKNSAFQSKITHPWLSNDKWKWHFSIRNTLETRELHLWFKYTWNQISKSVKGYSILIFNIQNSKETSQTIVWLADLWEHRIQHVHFLWRNWGPEKLWLTKVTVLFVS